jgi:hypothetical protein
MMDTVILGLLPDLVAVHLASGGECRARSTMAQVRHVLS